MKVVQVLRKFTVKEIVFCCSVMSRMVLSAEVKFLPRHDEETDRPRIGEIGLFLSTHCREVNYCPACGEVVVIGQEVADA